MLITGRNQAATYTLTRRDVTATASSEGCARTTAVKVGGPSLSAPYGEPGTLNCHQVTTDAADDVVHVNVRDSLGTANLAVFNGDGGAECSFSNRSCVVTGSTTHQVLVQTPATLKAAPDYHLDTLRIATADGPAPECTKVPSVSFGYGPVTGTLDEQHSAVCAVLPTAGFDRFDVEITDTDGAATTAVAALYNSRWTNGCSSSTSSTQCSAGGSSSAASPSLFLLGLPEKASRTSYSAKLTCSSTPCGPDRTSVTAVSPTTGVAGTKVKLTVTGTALGPDTEVRLTQSGRTLTATTDSVAADNRSVTATVDLTGTAVGTWNVSVFTRCCEYPRGTFTVTQPQLTNTTAPKVTGTAKVGAKVTALPGSWSAAPSSYTYQWKANGQAISGATASTYTMPAVGARQEAHRDRDGAPERMAERVGGLGGGDRRDGRRAQVGQAAGDQRDGEDREDAERVQGDVEHQPDVLCVPVVRERQGDQRGHQVLAGAEVGTAEQEDHREGDRAPHRSQGRYSGEQDDQGGREVSRRG